MQRIARTGEGKSGGYRAIVCFRRADRAFFVHGYAKSEKDNLNEAEVGLSGQELGKTLRN